MDIVLRILTNTPVWVFALLVFLVWQGNQSLRPRTQPIWRPFILPVVFCLMGLSRLMLARKGWEPVVAWIAAAGVFAALALYRGPRLLSIDRQNGRVTFPGSVVPLIRNITVFLLQYAVAVIGAMKLDTTAAVAILGHAVSGASAGYFSGWGLALLRRYRNADMPEGSQDAGRNVVAAP